MDHRGAERGGESGAWTPLGIIFVEDVIEGLGVGGLDTDGLEVAEVEPCGRPAIVAGDFSVVVVVVVVVVVGPSFLFFDLVQKDIF
jgi:hypothetical protein